MVRAYVKNLLFFVGTFMFWLDWLGAARRSQPNLVGEPSIWRSLGYSLLGLASWIGLALGGVWVAHLVVGDDPFVLMMVLLGWGFLVAPVVVVAALRRLFPDVSARLWAEFEKPGPFRRA